MASPPSWSPVRTRTDIFLNACTLWFTILWPSNWATKLFPSVPLQPIVLRSIHHSHSHKNGKRLPCLRNAGSPCALLKWGMCLIFRSLSTFCLNTIKIMAFGRWVYLGTKPLFQSMVLKKKAQPRPQFYVTANADPHFHWCGVTAIQLLHAPDCHTIWFASL